jgi:DNA-binding transcriptional MerR regulator
MRRIAPMERQYLTTRQVAKLLGVSLNTIYRWLNSEKISEPYRDPSNNYRLWTVEDIERIRQQLVTERT